MVVSLDWAICFYSSSQVAFRTRNGREYPRENCHGGEGDGASGDNIVYHDSVDISVAVSTLKGLVVPALRG